MQFSGVLQLEFFLDIFRWKYFSRYIFWYIYWFIIFLYVTSISLNRNDRKTKHTSKRKLMKSCLVWSMYINLQNTAFNCNLQLMQIHKKCVLIVRMQQQLPYRPTRWIKQFSNVNLYSWSYPMRDSKNLSLSHSYKKVNVIRLIYLGKWCGTMFNLSNITVE